MNPKIKVPSRVGDLAKLFQVTRKTIGRWRARGVPLNDLGALADWASGQRKLPAGFLARVIELRDGKPPTEKKTPATVHEVDPQWTEFLRLASSQATGDPKLPLAALGRARDFAAFKFQHVSEAGDKAGMKFFTDLLVRLESAVHDGELRARKLGLDTGDLYPGEAIDQLGQAVAYWLLNSATVLVGQAATALASAGPLDREGIRKALEPLFLTERVLVPMVRASQVNAQIRLPERFVDALKDGLASSLEDGGAEFDRLYQTPVTPPLAPETPPATPAA